MSNQTILVIEDERPLLEAIQKKLELNGFSVVTARSVEQAYEYTKDVGNIHAIWLDHYLLGKENGLDLVAHLKADESTKKSAYICSFQYSQPRQSAIVYAPWSYEILYKV